MRIIHASDIHLGSKFKSFNSDVKRKLNFMLQNEFKDLVNYARVNDINTILLSGDVFDGDRPLKADVEYFYSIIKENNDIDFYYLKGNHDKNSISFEELSNLHRFSFEYSYYRKDNVVISGIELNEQTQRILYSTLNLNTTDFNILMLHGNITTSVRDPLIDININKLKNKNIDYLALGHIHKKELSSLDSRGYYAYPGCLMGRGFDEIGQKGFYLIDTDKKEYSFIPFGRELIHDILIDLSNSFSAPNAISLIDDKLKDYKSESLINVRLQGEIDYDYSYVLHHLDELGANYLALRVENMLKIKIDVDEILKESSLRGEVLRVLSASEKEDLIPLALKLFDKDEEI